MRLLKEDDNQDKVNLDQNPNNTNRTQNTKQSQTTDDKSTNWSELYKNNRTDITKQWDAIKGFLSTLNLKGFDKNKIKNFVETNRSSLCLECDKYGLTKNNPFFIFLSQYLDTNNGDISPFLNKPDYWNIIHNCIANDIIDTKQLTFTCKEVMQPRILLNASLWKINPISDIFAVVKMYCDILDRANSESMNTDILNGYIKAAFSEQEITKKGQTLQVQVNMNSTTNVNKLLKALFFTDELLNLSKEKIFVNDEVDDKGILKINKVRQELNSKVSNVRLISSQINPVDLIEEQGLLLSQNVQLSNRGVNDEKQQNDTDKNNNYNKKYNDENKVSTKAKNTNSVQAKKTMLKKNNDWRKGIDYLEKTFDVGNNKLDMVDTLQALIDLVKDNL